MIHKYIRTCIVLFCFSIQFASAQDASVYRDKFTEGNYLILEENYVQALKTFLEAYAIDSSNANINYKVGFCYMKSANEKNKASHYLEKAITNVSNNYEDLEPHEKKAPENAYYYLAQAYHLNYRFDEAIEYFNKFKLLLGNKNKELIKDINHRIEICNNAKEIKAVPTSVDIINLGDSINTQYPEYSPVITADENMLIFTSRRPGSTGGEIGADGQFAEDIYVSYRKKDGTWGSPQGIGANVNSPSNEASISLTPDGQQLFLYKDDNGGDIYVSHLEGDTWSYPTPLEGDINSKGWETHACLTSDGNTLYFVSDRAGGFGGRDIYKCVKLPNGKWSKATNLGPTINTEYDEDSPFIHPNKVDLFFSSRGHKTMGGFDIFFSTLNPDSNKWSEPINIGYPINTTDDDVFYVASPDGKRAYYSSSRPGGHGDKDIYLIKFQQGTPEKPVALIKGFITSADGGEIPLDIQITATDKQSGEQVSNTKPIHRTGSYSMILEPGKSYILSYLVNGTQMATDTIDIPAGANYSEYDRPLLLNNLTLPKDAGTKTTEPKPGDHTDKNMVHTGKEHDGSPKNQVTYFGGKEFRIYFGYNEHNIDPTNADFTKFLDSLASVIKEKGHAKILVTGSASQVPTKAFNGNRELARHRAEDTKEVLIQAFKSHGIDESKVEFLKVKAIILGPTYRSDAQKHKETYRKYQYVSLKLATR
jgi:outer membrane protein OmpA-like peptidoglycan-associated protein